jgi:hypothetical protein
VSEAQDRLLYLGVGPLAAVTLGVALVPVRGLTTASNFTFLFLALTIVVAEFGGRAAAVVTAVASALSLDFFLTQPYLRLEIRDKHDLIAFVGLAGCGIIAAALASERGRGTRTASGKQVALLQSALAELPLSGPLESRLARILEAARASFPVAAAAVRDRTNRIVAASAHAYARPVPGETLDPEALVPPRLSRREELPLPPGGARLALVVGKRQVGWLDVWGDGGPASLESRLALAAVARALAALLADAER